MKKVFNLPAVPFIVFIVIALFGILFSSSQYNTDITGRAVDISTCSGTISYGISPQIVNASANTSMVFTISKTTPTNCSGGNVSIYLGNACSGTARCSCTLPNENHITWPGNAYLTSCGCLFQAPSIGGIYNYTACISDTSISRTTSLNVTAVNCASAGGICRSINMGNFSGTCNSTTEVMNSSFTCSSGQACCIPGTPIQDTCTPAGGYCSPLFKGIGACATNNSAYDETKTCFYGNGYCCMPVAAGATNITGCMNITTPGNYALKNDLTRPSSQNYCLWIGADNVVLDCKDHSIDGLGPYYTDVYGIQIGKEVSGGIITNVTLRNCNVTKWGGAIIGWDGIGIVISDNTLERNGFGISFSNISLILASNHICNKAYPESWDIKFEDSPTNTGTDNTCDIAVNFSDTGKAGCTNSCALNATIELNSPSENASFAAPTNITFRWTPKNFANSTPLCIPFAQTLDESYGFWPGYPDSMNLTSCNNSKKCAWISPEENNIVGSYSWGVYCVNSELDWSNFVNYNISGNVTPSDFGTFEITEEGAVNASAQTQGSLQCGAWGECTSDNKKYRTCADGSIQAENCTYYPFGEEIPMVIENWNPYPCTTSQKKVSQYANGTNLTEARPCRIENWKMVDCVNGVQVWEEQNNTGTEYAKPSAEPCEEKPFLQQLMPWAWIAAAAIVIVLIIIFITKGISSRRARAVLGAEKPAAKEAKPEAKEEYPELKSFISKAKSRGMAKEKIRKELLKSGWPEDVVESSLK